MLSGTFLALLGSPSPLQAIGKIRYVAPPPLGDDQGGANTCTLAHNPCATIQQAINQANNDDEIRAATGTYIESLSINRSLTLKGGFSSTDWLAADPETNQTTIRPSSGRVIHINNSSVVAHVTGFHLTGGSTGPGAGIYNQLGTLTLENNKIYGNNGGGDGGGIANGEASNAAILILRGNQIFSNTASNGGGLAVRSGSVTVEANKVFSNRVSTVGGGIYILNGNVTLKSNLIYTNSCNVNGGGIQIIGGNVKLENNTIYDNAAATYGGGLLAANVTVPMTNNLIISNTAGTRGGGIFSNTSISLIYNDFFNNYPDHLGNISLTIDPTTIGTNNRISDPLFIAPQSYNLELSPGSPAINSGTDSTAEIDFQGEGCPFGSGFDRGADEYTILGSPCYARIVGGQVYTNVQTAVNNAAAGGTVQVAGECVLTQSVSINKGLTLQGGYTVTNWLEPNYRTTLNANNTGRVVYVTGNGNVTIENLYLTGGRATGGGGNGAGVYLGASGSAILRNNVIYRNQADGYGGGVYNSGSGNNLLQHNTIYSNTAGSGGGGVYANTGAVVTLRNTLVVSNAGNGIESAALGGITSDYNNLYGNTPNNYGNPLTPAGPNDLSVPPGLANPAHNDFHLDFTRSQVVDKAEPASPVSIDFENDPRPQGSRADIGADESLFYTAVDISESINSPYVVTDTGSIANNPITFAHTITNTGFTPSYADTFIITVHNTDGWPVSLVGLSSPVVLTTGIPLSFEMVVTPTAPIPASIYNRTIITATSQSNGAIFDTAADIIANPGVELTPNYTENIDAGAIITYTHRMTNTGPMTDTFTLNPVSDRIPPWGSLVTPSTVVTLGPGQTIQVMVVVTVPLWAEAGLTERFQLTANSNTYPGVSAGVTDTTTANAIYGNRYASSSHSQATDNVNNCRDRNRPCLTVKRALEQVVGVGSTVYVASGTYNEYDLSVLKTITMTGGWNNAFSHQTLNPALTIINAGGQGRVMQIGNSSSVRPLIENFTFSGGQRIGGGGGVYVEGAASPMLRYNIIRNNQATNGGGIYNNAGTLTLLNSEIHSNQADTNGGGLYNHAGILYVRDNQVHGNQATGNGGGLYHHNLAATLVLTKSRIYNNAAGQRGGAVASAGNLLLLQNNFVYSNTAGSGAGALYISGGQATVEHNSLYNNAAGSGAGGIWLNGGTTAITSTIVFSHTGSGIQRSAGTVNNDYNNVYQNSGGNHVGLSAGPNSLSIDPYFENVVAANFHLHPDSLVIDRGNPASTLTKDIDDDDRPADQGPDIGADELVGCRATIDRVTIYQVIQTAVEASSPGQTILVHGTCRGVHPFDLGGGQTYSQTVHIVKNITLQGGWNYSFSALNPLIYPTILDARGLGRTMLISGATAAVENFHAVNGNAAVAGGPNSGGGVYLLNSNATLRNNQIYNNDAGQGGGVFNNGGNAALQNNQIYNNTAATQGGGFFNSSGAPTIERNRIYNNLAATGGGGIYNSSGALALFNNFVYTNTVSGGNGGGLFNTAISATVLHNTFYRNQANGGGRGGAVYNANSSTTGLDVRSNIFAQNSAGDGGALYNAGVASFNYNDTWNNSAPELVGAAGANNITGNPQFANPGAADFHLQGGSPAIDVADPTVSLMEDIDLDPRPSNQGFDIGADELAGCYASLASNPTVIYGNVQRAVDVASASIPDTVRVAGICQGVHPLTLGATTFTQTVHVTKNITLQGGWTWNPVLRQLQSYNPNNYATLDAVTLGRPLLVTNATVTIENFNIINGNATLGGGPAAGGALYHYNGDLTLRHNNFYSNTALAGSGGALYNAGGVLNLVDSLLHNNQTTNGGAVYLASGDQTLANNTIYSNTATNGGAVYLANGSHTLANNTLHSNTATTGGAVYLANGPSLLSANAIKNNFANQGAAVYNANPATVTLQNNLVYSNTANSFGGGFYNAAGSPLLQHNTFYGNQAASNGDGLYIAAGAPTISNTLVINNGNVGLRVAGGSAGVVYSDFYGQATNYSGITDQTGSNGNISADPLFVNAVIENFHLLGINSPAADTGDPATTLDIDFEDDFRPSNQGFDMGADEISSCFARLNGGVVLPNGRTIVGNPQIVVDAATSDADVVDIAGTCYGVNTRGGFRQTLYVTKTLTIQGGWSTSPLFAARNPALYPTTLDPLGQGRALYVDGGLTVAPGIRDLNLRNGDAGGLGGDGGGVYNNSNATLSQLNIYSNTATNGGGIYSMHNAQLDRLVVFSNTATNGGGLYNAGGAPTLEINQFYNNTAIDGAGLYIAAGLPNIWNNIVRHNTAGADGGGFYLASPSGATVLNNTIYNNIANDQGGGIYVAAGAPDLRNLIVDRNRANGGAGSGGGVYVAGGAPSLQYNDVSRSIAGDNYGGMADPTGVNGNISVDPLFVDEMSLNFQLTNPADPTDDSPISPAVDAGDPATTLVDEDFIGAIRPTHQYIDMGAYELGGCYARSSNPLVPGIFGSPQQVVNLSSAGDTVDIAGVCYGVNNTGGSDQNLYVTKTLTIQGGWQPDFSVPRDPNGTPTILNALNRGRVLYFDGGNPDFNSFDFVRGDAGGLGGGSGGQDAGGCIHIANGTPEFYGAVRVYYCQADLGGALYNVASNFVMYNTAVFWSAAQHGGGFYNASGSPVQQNIIYWDNIATDNGGGIYIAGGSPDIWHTNLLQNQAGDRGGGIYNASASTFIRNSIFDWNTADNEGGGLYQTAGPADVDYSNWYRNTAITNTSTADSNVFTGTNSLSLNPLYLSLPNSRLSEASPLIDAGAPITAPFAFDVDSEPRPQINGYDIGWDEVPQRIAFTLEPNRSFTADPCEVFTTTHTLSNLGNMGDTYTITLQSNSPPWNNHILPIDPLIVSLDEGQSFEFTFQIEVPCSATGGLVNTSVLQATSARTGGIDTAVDATTVNTFHGVEIAPSRSGTAAPGQTVTYTHVVTNLGNVTDTFGISLSPDYSNPTVTPPTLQLGPNQSTTITVSVTLLDWPAKGLLDIVDVVAYRLADPNVDDAVADHTSITGTTGVRYVAANGSDENNNCTDLVYGACATGQQAANQAAPGDEIWISSGVYTNVFTATAGGVITQAVYLDKSVTLRGGYNADDWDQAPNHISYTTIIDPQGLGRGLYLATTGPITIDRLTIRNGDATGLGGGPSSEDAGGNIYNEGANLRLSAIRLANGSATRGGSLFNFVGDLLLQNCMLHGNTATAQGGAIYNTNGTIILENNTFYNNQATVSGGGIHIDGDLLLVTNTIFATNTAPSGGAIYAGFATTNLDYNLYYLNQTNDVQGATKGAHDFSDNPQFIDPLAALPDLHLQSGSPAIDQGNPATTLNIDYDSDPRPLPGPGMFDIGADERLQIPGVLFTPNVVTFTVAPSTVVISHTLQNTGEFSDVFTITYTTNRPWAIAFAQTPPYPISLSPGESRPVIVTYTVPAGAEGQSWLTVITAASNNVSAGVTDQINVSSPQWQIGKTVNPPGPVQPGAYLTYTLTISNNGDLDSSGYYTVTDQLPTYTHFVAATGSPVTTTPAVQWVTDTVVISNGGAISFTYVVTVTRSLTDNTAIVNNVYQINGGGAPNPAIGAPVTVTVSAPAMLIATKRASNNPAQAGGYLTYTITITNQATAPGPALNMVISDTLPANVVYQSMGFESPATGTYTYTGNLLRWQLNNALWPGDSLQVTASVRVTSPLAAQTILTNTYMVTAGNMAGTASGALTTAVTSTNVISLHKTVDPTTTAVGQVVTYTVVLTNSGNGIATVAFTDLLPSGFIPTTYFTNVVVPGRTWSADGAATLSFTATTALTVGTYYNRAVTATYSLTSTVITHTAPVTLIAPLADVSLLKTPANQFIRSGGAATFTLYLTNTGSITLTTVTIADPLAPDCDGQVFNNVGLGESRSYTCVFTNATSTFTNTAIATGTPEIGGLVATDTAIAVVTVVTPDIEISKLPLTQAMQSGLQADFTIIVTNTGDITLTTVTVGDPRVANCDGSALGPLAPGDSDFYTCAEPGVTADFTNIATATGTPEIGGAVVTHSASAYVTVITPAIQIAKLPYTQTAAFNTPVTFTIIVTNTGTAPLTNVIVTDPQAPACNRFIGSLPGGAYNVGTCAITATVDLTNTAVVTATPPAGPDIGDEDTAYVDVLLPDLELAKLPGSQMVQYNDAVTFTIYITNTGDLTLTVAISDTNYPACDHTASLSPGLTDTYTCSVANVTASFTNTIAATGTATVGGSMVTETASALVTVISPSLQIAKTPDTQTVIYNDPVTFTIYVTNTGDVTLNPVTVSDPLVPDCNRNLGSLLAGQAIIPYSCVLPQATVDFTNTAVAGGLSPLSSTVSQTDTAYVEVIGPDIEISKLPTNQDVQSGDPVTFTISVTNTGDITLTVAVSDTAIAGGLCDRTTTLVPGQPFSYTCNLSLTADFTNTVVATGTPTIGGGTVTDTANASVNVVEPDITISKTPDNQFARYGDTVTFTIRFSNTGDIALQAPITVTDIAVPACMTIYNSILPVTGGVWDYTCAAGGVTADFTNTVVITAVPFVGDTVTGTDIAVVNVVSPSLQISKTPDSQQVVTGGTANFTITITNTGDITLTGVTIRDPLASGCNQDIATLPPNAPNTYSCQLNGVPGTLTNTVIVTGAPMFIGGVVTDDDTAQVIAINPGLDIAKTPDSQVGYSGQPVTFTIYVTNTGDVALSPITVTDVVAPACDNVLALGPGLSTSYECNVTLTSTVDVINTAVVTGLVPGTGIFVTASDTALIDYGPPERPTLISPPNLSYLNTVNVPFVWSPSADTVTYTLNVSGVLYYDVLAPATTHTPALPGEGVYTWTMQAIDAYSRTLGYTDTWQVTVDLTPPTAFSLISPPNGAVITTTARPMFSWNSSIDILSGPVTYTLIITNSGGIPTIYVTNTPVFTPPANLADDDYTWTVVAYDRAGNATPSDDTYTITINVPAVGGGIYLPLIVKTGVPAPDLIVSGMTVTPTGGGNAAVEVTVTNQSAVPVAFGNNFHVAVYADGNFANYICNWGVQGSWFGAGQSYVLTGDCTTSPGTHIFTAWADPFNVVVESNEANNTYDVNNITITGPGGDAEAQTSPAPSGPLPTPTLTP
ncbi:MAG: DUF11 domain-containing protein [Anaerolineae bacterium]|nr:DUF11 domain-containing protein [Anaerolineae bacterium]